MILHSWANWEIDRHSPPPSLFCLSLPFITGSQTWLLWPECVYLTKSVCLNRKPQSDAIRRWDFGRWLERENRALRNRISVLMKQTPWRSLTLSAMQSESISCSVRSLRPLGLQPTRLLWPQDSPGKNTAM